MNAKFAGARAMQSRNDYAIPKHCNLAHMYQPMCQHWLTTHNVTCSLENLCCPTIAQCRFVGESQIIPIINLSTAQQVYCHAVGRCTPECCETGDAQGCKPIMLCNVKPQQRSWVGGGKEKQKCFSTAVNVHNLLEP